MSTISTILIVTIILVTLNTVLTLYQLQSAEKERVQMGYPAFSNFDYYYPIFSWLVGIIVLILFIVIPNSLPEPTGLLATIIYCIGAIVVYILSGMIATYILSIVQSKLVKKGSK